MSSDKAKRVIFIGNIPYGLSEEQITSIFSNVGPVLNFRLVYDKESGKPKGFGFAEFQDADAAASAVRNLNDYEIMGRKLRVDYSNEGGGDSGQSNSNSHHQHSNSQNQQDTAAMQSSGLLPPLPPGADLQPGLTCPDAISKTLNTLPPPQLLDVLSQMKGLVMQDPAKATELLRAAPQLSYAIFQALLLLGLVDTSILASVVGGAPPPPPPQQLQQPPIPHHAAPPPPMPPHMQPHQPPHMPTPPNFGQPYQPPPPPQPPQQQQAHDPQRAALIQQVMSLTPQQLAAYPEEHRQQLEQIRQAVLAGRF